MFIYAVLEDGSPVLGDHSVLNKKKWKKSVKKETRYWLLYVISIYSVHIISFPHIQCVFSFCHHLASVVVGPFVVRHKLSHLNLLLWNPLNQTKPNLTGMVIGWVPFKIVSDRPTLHSKWLLLLKIEISSIVHCCFIIILNELTFFLQLHGNE